MNFLLVCGGSAGHVNPALAISEQLQNEMPNSRILFVGADKAVEKRLIPEAGFDLINIKMSGIRRGFSPGDILHNIKTAINLVTADFKSSKLLKSYNPDAVIGTGGYICYPVLKKAASFGIPTFVLEPNAYPGLTVKMLSLIVDKVFVSYEGMEKRFRKPERVVYTGTPLRKKFYNEINISDQNAKKKKPLVISYWGSLGATSMNEMIVDFITMNIREDKFDHIHATGVGRNAEDIRKRLETLGLNDTKTSIIDIREYIDDMPTVMKASDIVLTRSGASTIAELTALYKPSVLIPSPNVTENHQEENAMQLQKAGGAVMIRESECTGEMLYGVVSSLLDDKEKLKRMSETLESISTPNAAAKIVESVMQLCACGR